jgi:hypothetical protein
MLSEPIVALMARHKEHRERQARHRELETENIHVDEIASKVATFYDKFRNLIQYHEAHLLRKGSIERILRRRVLLNTSSGNFAEAFIKDLIRSGHLPNDTVPDATIAGVQRVIDNLLFLLHYENEEGGDGHRQISSWLLEIFVPALEEELFPPPESQLVGEMMYEVMRDRLVLKKIPLSDDEIKTQLFIATQRAVLRFDDDQMQYTLLKFLYPNWGKMSELELQETAPKLGDLRKDIQGTLKNRFGPYFLKLCQREKTPFQLTGDLILEDALLAKNFDAELVRLYDEQAERTAQQLKKLAFFSVLSFLISKVVVALALEIPLDRVFHYPFSILNTTINILFPPFLMLLIVTFVRPPSEKNFELVAHEVKNIISRDNPRSYVVSVPEAARGLTAVLVYLAYGIALAAILYAIIKALLWISFSPFSIVIFLLFTSMIIATGVKINNRAKEMSLEKKRSTVLGFLADLVIIPFMALGQWVIAGLSNFNIIVIVFDFFIELPLGFFVEFLESFRKFIDAKKEEVQ